MQVWGWGTRRWSVSGAKAGDVTVWGNSAPGEGPGGMDTQGTNEGQSCCGLHIWVLPEFAES